MILNAEDVQPIQHRTAWLTTGQMVGRPGGKLNGRIPTDAKHCGTEMKIGLKLGLLRAVGQNRERGGDLRRRLLCLAKRTPLEAGLLHAEVVADGGVQLKHLGLENGQVTSQRA